MLATAADPRGYVLCTSWRILRLKTCCEYGAGPPGSTGPPPDMMLPQWTRWSAKRTTGQMLVVPAEAGEWLLLPKGVKILDGACREVPQARGMMQYSRTSHTFAIFEVKAAGQEFVPFLSCRSSVLAVTSSSLSFFVPTIKILGPSVRGALKYCI